MKATGVIDRSKTIRIELSEQDALKFKEFMQFHAKLVAVISSGALNVRNGKAILNFDSEGNINDIEVSYHTYKVGKPTTGVIAGSMV